MLNNSTWEMKLVNITCCLLSHVLFCFLSKGVNAVGCFDGHYCGATGLTAALNCYDAWHLDKNNNSSKEISWLDIE